MSSKRTIITTAVLTVLLVTGCSVFEAVLRPDLPDSIDTARMFYFGLDLKGAERVLQRVLAAPDEKPKVRAEALRMQARIAWKFHRKLEKAYELLRQAVDLKVEQYETLAVLSQIEREAGDFQKALATASRSIKLAASERQWVEARSLWAQAVWEQSLARIENSQSFDADLVKQGVATLKEVLQKAPGYPDPSRILLGLALLARNGEDALTAWKSYFTIIDENPPKGILAGPYDLLGGVLPGWQDRNLSRQEGLTLIGGLGDSRFYEYGRLVQQLYFEDDSFRDEPRVRDMLLYADTIASFRTTADEYYRMWSLGKRNEAGFKRSLSKEAESLWLALSSESERPDFSFADFCAEMEKRFGAAIILGGTSNYKGKALIMGHLVDRQKRTIRQYGFESELVHLVYDMMVSNGYSSWFWDGTAHIGGWATGTGICEVRWGKIRKFYKMWWRINEDAERKKTQEYIADRLDAEELAISRSISAPLDGLGVRMIFEATNAAVDKLRHSGLEARDLTMAFVRYYDQFEAKSKISAHEGRHAIDKKFFAVDYKFWSQADREYRAKLSEITFSPDPYLALGELLLQSVSKSGHGKANLRIRRVLLKWMKEHLSEIEGIDTDRSLLVQAHLLTADQIRRCFTAADPLARKSR